MVRSLSYMSSAVINRKARYLSSSPEPVLPISLHSKLNRFSAFGGFASLLLVFSRFSRFTTAGHPIQDQIIFITGHRYQAFRMLDIGINYGPVHWTLRSTPFVGFGVSKNATALCMPDLPGMVIQHLGETMTISGFR